MPEYMNIAMANAILKVLEEPPAKTLFLLIASDYEKLLPTIISRCQLIHIPAFEKDDVKKYLLTKNLCDETMASRIMKIADGDMDKAVQLCSSYNHDELELFSKWMRLCFGRKYLEMVPFVDDISKIGREKQKNLMLFGIQLLRDSLMQKQELAELIHRDEEELKFIQNFSKALSDKVIAELSELLSETYVHIERNGNAKIIFMDTSIKLGNCFARK
jgi:DNA polymerase-3 subunit delta'